MFIRFYQPAGLCSLRKARLDRGHELSFCFQRGDVRAIDEKVAARLERSGNPVWSASS